MNHIDHGRVMQEEHMKHMETDFLCAYCFLLFFLPEGYQWGSNRLGPEVSPLWNQYVFFFFASSLSYGEGHQSLYFSCFEIDDTGDISPPHGVKVAMEMQVEAERRKRAQILEAEGKKHAQILESEGIDYTTFFIWRSICGSNSSSGKRIIWWQFNLQIHSKCFSFDVTCMQEQVMMLL